MIDISQYFEAPDQGAWLKLATESIKDEKRLNFKSVEGVTLGLQYDNKELVLNSFPSETALVTDSDLKNTTIVDVDKVHNAGGSIVQELVYSLSAYSKYSSSSISKISFKVSVDSFYFNNIAKLRALRFLIERLNDHYKAFEEFEIITVNSRREQTLYDPWSNMLRNTFSSMASLNGGADKTIVSSYDKLGSDFYSKKEDSVGLRQAENIYYVLKEESLLGTVKDPSSGSHSIEGLSKEFCELAMEKFKVLESKGGLFEDIKSWANEVKEVANERERLVLTVEKVISGVNSYSQLDDNLEKLYGTNDLKIENDDLFPLSRPVCKLENLRYSLSKKDIKLGVCTYGSSALVGAREKFAKNILEVSGHKISDHTEYDLLVLCAVDEDYEAAIEASKNLKSKRTFIATSKIKIEGVDNIYKGQNILDVFSHLVEEAK